MIHTEMPIEDVAEAVRIWIPGFRVQGKQLSKTKLEEGDECVYSLRCTRNEMIDDFKVTVRAVSPSEEEVTVMGVDGRTTAFRRPTDYDDFVGSIRNDAPSVAMETVHSDFGDRSCWVHLITGDHACMAWICDGIAFRTIHDAGGYRLAFDIDSSTML